MGTSFGSKKKNQGFFSFKEQREHMKGRYTSCGCKFSKIKISEAEREKGEIFKNSVQVGTTNVVSTWTHLVDQRCPFVLL